MTEIHSKPETARDRAYVRDIVNGLVPSDPEFPSVCVIVGNDDPNTMTAEKIARAASLIRQLRNR